jgi:hypothetical protein
VATTVSRVTARMKERALETREWAGFGLMITAVSTGVLIAGALWMILVCYVVGGTVHYAALAGASVDVSPIILWFLAPFLWILALLVRELRDNPQVRTSGIRPIIGLIHALLWASATECVWILLIAGTLLGPAPGYIDWNFGPLDWIFTNAHSSLSLATIGAISACVGLPLSIKAFWLARPTLFSSQGPKRSRQGSTSTLIGVAVSAATFSGIAAGWDGSASAAQIFLATLSSVAMGMIAAVQWAQSGKRRLAHGEPSGGLNQQADER